MKNKYCQYCGSADDCIIVNDERICKSCSGYILGKRFGSINSSVGDIAKARLQKARQIRKMNEEKDDVVIKKWEDPFIKNKK